MDAIQLARRLLKAARGSGRHQVAPCEVGEMLTEQLGLHASIHGLFAYVGERWDGKGVETYSAQLRPCLRMTWPSAA